MPWVRVGGEVRVCGAEGRRVETYGEQGQGDFVLEGVADCPFPLVQEGVVRGGVVLGSEGQHRPEAYDDRAELHALRMYAVSPTRPL